MMLWLTFVSRYARSFTDPEDQNKVYEFLMTQSTKSDKNKKRPRQ